MLNLSSDGHRSSRWLMLTRIVIDLIDGLMQRPTRFWRPFFPLE